MKTSILLLKQPNYYFDVGILLMDEGTIEPKYLQALKAFAKYCPVIRLNLNSEAKANDISDVTFVDELLYDPTCIENICEQVEKHWKMKIAKRK